MPATAQLAAAPRGVTAETGWLSARSAPQSRPRPRSEEGAGLGSRNRRATTGSAARASEDRLTQPVSAVRDGPPVATTVDDEVVKAVMALQPWVQSRPEPERFGAALRTLVE